MERIVILNGSPRAPKSNSKCYADIFSKKYNKDIEYFKSSLLYYGIIACFVIGAIIGNFFIHILQEKAILCCSALLFFVFFLMFIDFEREKL